MKYIEFLFWLFLRLPFVLLTFPIGYIIMGSVQAVIDVLFDCPPWKEKKR